jgi:hypothetical protein
MPTRDRADMSTRRHIDREDTGRSGDHDEAFVSDGGQQCGHGEVAVRSPAVTKAAAWIAAGPAR